MNCSEVTVILKDESRTIRQKHLVYETVTTAPDDPIIASLVKETRKNFDGTPTEVSVKITLTL